MKPKLVFRRGGWYCAGQGAWGAGETMREAWASWLFDKRGMR